MCAPWKRADPKYLACKVVTAAFTPRNKKELRDAVDAFIPPKSHETIKAKSSSLEHVEEVREGKRKVSKGFINPTNVITGPPKKKVRDGITMNSDGSCPIDNCEHICKSMKVPTFAPGQTRSGVAENEEARRLVSALERTGQSAEFIPLTDDGSSWLVVARKWRPSRSRANFESEWNLHPVEARELVVFGRRCKENRFSQQWGHSYSYSGQRALARPIPPASFLATLMDDVNGLVSAEPSGAGAGAGAVAADGQTRLFNACLQNWYEPQHTIGVHSDDERDMRRDQPIFSLTWSESGVRRFRLRPKVVRGVAVPGATECEVWMGDGDLVVMGGQCQRSHTHEVPKIRKKDPQAGRRINWTVRSFRV